MTKRPQLVEVTELGRQIGFAFGVRDPGLQTWLSEGLGDATASVPVYFTQQLWDLLGQAPEGQDSSAQRVLRAAHGPVREQVVGRNAWRTAFSLELSGKTGLLWLVIGHSFSDGIVIGLGPGDLW